MAPPLVATPDGSATPDALRLFGYGLLSAGDLGGAVQIADALLLRDPRDVAALLLRAQAGLALGRPGQARRDAREAWRRAARPDARFAAAMFLAQSLASEGYLNRGQFWLRRAANAAEAPAETGLVASEYRRLRSANPLIWGISFSITPSSNVNAGSTADHFTLPIGPGLGMELPLGGAQKALSGQEARLGARLSWRLVPTATTMTAFHLSADHRKIMLSSEARAEAPEVRASDFDRTNLDLGLTRRWRPLGADTIYTFGAWAGHDRQGGMALANSLRLTVQAEHAMTPRLVGLLGLSAERSHRLDAAIRSTDVLGLNFGGQYLLAGQDRLTLILGLAQIQSESAGSRGTSASARLGWQKGAPIRGVGVEAWASLEARDYPDSPFALQGRRDLRSTLNLSLAFEEIRYMGFSPTLDVMASRNRSDVGLYETREMGLQFGFRSAF